MRVGIWMLEEIMSWVMNFLIVGRELFLGLWGGGEGVVVDEE